ncbi:MAG TPA: GNAT family N-acetyltransferase [Clostridiales bacterium]|nr:GNAT family N-acetyltransferase [Clostridiales bacterium]
MTTAATERILVGPLEQEDRAKTEDSVLREAATAMGGAPRCFAVTLRDTAAIIGYVTACGEELDFYITPQERDKGFAFEALCLSFDLLFGCEGVKRLTAVCEEQNLYAIKALCHAGMVKEKAENGYFYGVLTAADWERL